MTLVDSKETREEEGALLTSILDGQTWKFESLVKSYQHRIFVGMFALLGNRQDAEDVTQEAFVTAYRKLEGFEHRSSFYTWLRRIAWNLAIDLQRQRVRHRNGLPGLSSLDEQDVSGIEPTPEAKAISNETASRVQHALSMLDPERRNMIVLRDLQGLDYSEIAELLDIPIGTVRSRLHRGRIELREAMQSIGLELEQMTEESVLEHDSGMPRGTMHAGDGS